MSRYIDADAMKEWIDEYVSVFKKSDNKDIKGYIEHQPTIDIVRCSECVYADKYYHCNYMTTWNNPDDFCSYGERRSDG